MITEAIQHYYPDWEPPPDRGRAWEPCRCPFHKEQNPSASINYAEQGFHCFGCGVGGDVFSIIMHEEKVKFAEAVEIAERLSLGGVPAVRESGARKRRRRVFGEQRDTGDEQVRAGVRGRSAPWS